MLVTFIIVSHIAISSVQSSSLCDPCKDSDPFGEWTSWSSCSPKTNNACHKVQKRVRSRGIFFCDYCREETQERRCQKCEQECSNGVCSCNGGYVLRNDKLTCSRLSCDSLGTRSCPLNSYKDSNGNACKDIVKRCSNGNFYQSKCSLSCPSGYGLAVISTLPERQYFAEFLNESDFKSVKKDASCILNPSNLLAWDVDVSSYFCRRLNDAPRNLKLSNTKVDEQLPANTLVANISSFDEEEDAVYKIESSEGSTLFNILGDKLRTSKSLFWKDLIKTTVELKIVAIDKLKPAVFTSKIFYIEIANIDDPPTNLQLSNTKFDDLTEVSHVIGQFQAEDTDKRPSVTSGDFTWSLVKQTSEKNFKIIGHSLVLRKKFSTKNEDFFTTITVRCTEKTVNAKSSEKTFTLSFENLNNPVIIESTISNPIQEGTQMNTTVGNVTVTDKEGDNVTMTDVSDTNTKAKFKLTEPMCVKENGTTKCISNIVLIAALNYEESSEYTIAIEVHDEHNEKSRLITKVLVKDVNEKPSQINFDKNTLFVPERSSKGYLIASISVVDEDENVVGCSIQNGAGLPFEIKSFSLLVKDDDMLDFEKKNSYTLTIKCVDIRGLSIERTTQILVEDINEKPANPCTTVIMIKYDSPINSEVVTLNAIDSDNEVFSKQIIFFESASNFSPFVVIGNNIVVNETLQPAHHYLFNVKVTDNGVLMQHQANGGLKTYTGKPVEAVYQCIIKTSDPCDAFHEYKNGLCQCKGKLTGVKCDRDPTKCQPNNCGPGNICSQFVSSPVPCFERIFQLSMLLPISSNEFVDQKFRHNLEMYIDSILEGTIGSKTLKNLEGKAKRKRRSTTSDTYYVEIGEQMSIKGVYTLVRFLPYVTVNGSYILKDRNTLCPKFDTTDVRCLNTEDCEILKTAGITCGPGEGRQVNVQGAKGDDNDEESGTALYTFIVPIAIAIIIVIIILFLLYRRRNRQDKEYYPEEAVVYNNQRNNLEYPASLPRKPLNTDQPEHGQTMSEIERNRQLTDLNRFNSRVFDDNKTSGFECGNPAYGIQRNIDPNNVNYRENRAYVEDSDQNNLEVANPSNPLYASIGKAAKNPLYQSSMKDSHKNNYVDVNELKDTQCVGLVEEQKAKEKEYAMIDDIEDASLRQIRRGPSLNLFTPEKDNDNEDKTFKKTSIGESDA